MRMRTHLVHSHSSYRSSCVYVHQVTWAGNDAHGIRMKGPPVQEICSPGETISAAINSMALGSCGRNVTLYRIGAWALDMNLLALGWMQQMHTNEKSILGQVMICFTIRQPAITWTDVDPDLCHHMALLLGCKLTLEEWYFMIYHCPFYVFEIFWKAYRIIHVLEWRTVYALTRELFWCLFPELRSNGGNKHQNNTQVSV